VSVVAEICLSQQAKALAKIIVIIHVAAATPGDFHQFPQ